MTPKQFAKFVQRDLTCWHCGSRELIPHHRSNRGMGGSKLKDNSANILTMCAEINGLMESDSNWQYTARLYGWKLYGWQDPQFERVYDLFRGEWFLLDNDFGRVAALD
jgi:hypothetical protein